jgi:phage RecT family recombinase
MGTAITPRDRMIPYVELIRSKDDVLRPLAAASGYTPEHIVAQFQHYAADNPALLQCTPHSVVTALLTVAETGLILGRTCDLLPFNVKKTLRAQFNARYTGLIELAYASKTVRSIDAEVVRDGDPFEWRKGTGGYIHHQPMRDPAKKITHVWACAQTGTNAYVFVIRTREEIEDLRNEFSKQWNQKLVEHLEDIPWYAIKSAYRALCNILPKNRRLAAALAGDVDALNPDDEVLPPEPPPVAGGPMPEQAATHIVDAAKPATEAPTRAAGQVTPFGSTLMPVERKAPVQEAEDQPFPNWSGHPYSGKTFREVPDAVLVEEMQKAATRAERYGQGNKPEAKAKAERFVDVCREILESRRQRALDAEKPVSVGIPAGFEERSPALDEDLDDLPF